MTFYADAVAGVLVVDDDKTLASVLVDYLRRAGHRTEMVHHGGDALKVVESGDYDGVILDVMLPGIGGLEVCRRLRAGWPDVSVVMLTALGGVDDRIAGLEVGADDYVGKPFSPRELVLRVESVLRRSSRTSSTSEAPVVTAGAITLDPRARRAWLSGAPLELTLREFDLLAQFMTHPGVVFSRDQLMRDVWGWMFGDQSTVTVHVRRLREKIEEDPTHPEMIKTVWGVGYRMDLS